MIQLINIFSSFIQWTHSTSSVKHSRQPSIILLSWRGWVFSIFCKFNSFWSSDAIWQHRFGSIMVQIMTCCLTAPSHYLNKFRLIIHEAHCHLAEDLIINETHCHLAEGLIIYKAHCHLAEGLIIYKAHCHLAEGLGLHLFNDDTCSSGHISRLAEGLIIKWGTLPFSWRPYHPWGTLPFGWGSYHQWGTLPFSRGSYHL